MKNRYTDGSYLAGNPAWHAQDASWKLRHILRVLDQAGVKDFGCVLDAGCGSGDIIKEWAVQAPQVQFTGWDISPQAHALAVRNAPCNVQFVQGEKLPLQRFDLALAIDVIEHIESAEEWMDEFCQRAFLAVLHVPLDLSVYALLRPEILEQERRSVGHIHFFTTRSLKRFLGAHHCQILASHYTNKYVECSPQLASWKSRLGMFIRKAVHVMLPRSWAAFWVGGYSLMLVIRTPKE